MLTVKDINNKRFEPVKNGYSTIEVDDYLKLCANSLKQLQTENDDLRQKISICVENVREYQKKEADIAGALLDIQRSKRFAIEDAQAEARKVIADAHEQAKAILGNTGAKLRSEKSSYEEMKREVATFKENILAMYKEHLSILTAIPDEYDDLEDDEPTPVPDEHEDDLPIPGAVTASVSDTSPEAGFMEPEQPENSDQSELYKKAFGAKPVPGKADKFDPLKFGQNV
ncbi:MAG: DivIVA domain-containing protein [Ruminococcus sp.]|jgi:cell division initiation protein|nr:DivIVA domain-containing protein [Ruminococcus sp.]